MGEYRIRQIQEADFTEKLIKNFDKYYILAYEIPKERIQMSWFFKNSDETHKYSQYSSTLVIDFKSCYFRYRVNKSKDKLNELIQVNLKLKSVGFNKIQTTLPYPLTYSFIENPNQQVLKLSKKKQEIENLKNKAIGLSEILTVEKGGYNFNIQALKRANEQFEVFESGYIREYETFSSKFSRITKIKKSMILKPIAKRETSPRNYSAALKLSQLTAKDEFTIYKGREIMTELKTQQKSIQEYEILGQTNDKIQMGDKTKSRKLGLLDQLKGTNQLRKDEIVDDVCLTWIQNPYSTFIETRSKVMLQFWSRYTSEILDLSIKEPSLIKKFKLAPEKGGGMVKVLYLTNKNNFRFCKYSN